MSENELRLFGQPARPIVRGSRERCAVCWTEHAADVLILEEPEDRDDQPGDAVWVCWAGYRQHLAAFGRALIVEEAE